MKRGFQSLHAGWWAGARVSGRANVLGIVLLAVCLTGCEKYSLDERVKELCAEDGGIKVHETVKLSPAFYDEEGEPIPGKPSNLMEERLGPGYRLTHDMTYIKRGDPEKGEGQLYKSSWTVVRVADEKVLVSAIVYGRQGGDLINIGHFSSKRCPQDLGAPKAVIRSAFINTAGRRPDQGSEQGANDGKGAKK